MQRFGEYDGDQGLGQHFSVNHKNKQFVDHVNLRQAGIRVHHKVTTNHIEATWHQLKENIESTTEFIDVQDNRYFMISGYIDYYVFCRRQ